MTRLDEDVEGVYEYYQILFLRIGTSVLLLVGVILSVAMKNRLTALLMLAVSLFSIWIYKVISDFGTKCYLKSSQAAAVFNGILKDKLGQSCGNPSGRRRKTCAGFPEKKPCMKNSGNPLPAGQMYGRLWRASTVMEVISVGGTLLIASFVMGQRNDFLGTAYLFYNYVDLIYAPPPVLPQSSGRPAECFRQEKACGSLSGRNLPKTASLKNTTVIVLPLHRPSLILHRMKIPPRGFPEGFLFPGSKKPSFQLPGGNGNPPGNQFYHT